jgi:hypothetical protein
MGCAGKRCVASKLAWAARVAETARRWAEWVLELELYILPTG